MVKVIPPYSIKRYRYRVHCLAADLWSATDPELRVNLALRLADAATTLARLEVQESDQNRRHLLSPAD